MASHVIKVRSPWRMRLKHSLKKENIVMKKAEFLALTGALGEGILCVCQCIFLILALLKHLGENKRDLKERELGREGLREIFNLKSAHFRWRSHALSGLVLMQEIKCHSYNL